MSEAFHIISDGSCDLPLELTKEKNITVVPFYVSFEEGKYQKEMVEIGVREFYQKMVDHPDVYPKSLMSKRVHPLSVSALRPNSVAPCSPR